VKEMLQNKQNLLLILVIILIGYNIFNTNSIRTDVKGYKAEIELLQTKVDSTKTVNKQIDIKIDSVKENVVSITKEIHHIDNTITIIKKQTDEKANNAGKFSNVELEQFFANRYNKSLHTN
jgi:septal ring factor EnvC (AmiA/AmiB activator)